MTKVARDRLCFPLSLPLSNVPCHRHHQPLCSSLTSSVTPSSVHASAHGLHALDNPPSLFTVYLSHPPWLVVVGFCFVFLLYFLYFFCYSWVIVSLDLVILSCGGDPFFFFFLECVGSKFSSASPPQPPLGDHYCYLTEIRIRLKGLSRIMSLSIQVGLKSVASVMHLPSSILASILLYAANSLAFAQGIKDQDMFYPFGDH
jgi:hypothetical protein